ncbi:MAG: diaminopimelate epimerase [Bacteroidales bacterium]|nr:diaminopimelate epimerase [Bacteroidales bacterium]
MGTPFYKYHGTGNDFIIIDDRQDVFIADREVIAGLCHRQLGVGADGLILIHEAFGYDFSMQYFNADGREGTMCGNGGRCVSALVVHLGIATGPDLQFLAIDGPHRSTIRESDGDHAVVSLKMKDVPDVHCDGGDYIMDTGSPHLVRFLMPDNLESAFQEGREIRHSAPFRKEGINVDFVEEREGYLHVVTYERGVERITLSCGTGVTAAALAFAMRRNLTGGTIRLETPGGALKVSFSRNEKGFSDIWLEGPATYVFRGTTRKELLSSGR